MLALAMGNPSIPHQETPYTPCRLCQNFRGLHTSDLGWIFIDCAERGRYTQVDPAIGCRFWVRDREANDACNLELLSGDAMTISNEQLVEVLIGVAKTHAAVFNAAFGTETVLRQVIPTLQGQAQILPPPGQPVNLQNVYAKILMQCIAGSPNNAALQQYYSEELGKLPQA